jgi:hypothetical protein
MKRSSEVLILAAVLLLVVPEAFGATAPTKAVYSVGIRFVSDSAQWCQSARVVITPAGDAFVVTVRDAKLSIEQASPEDRGTIESSYGGYEGAWASVKLDARGNILSIGQVTSPAAVGGVLPVTEADIRNILGLCVLALPPANEKPTLNAGDSWLADYLAATPQLAGGPKLKTLNARMKLANIRQVEGKRIGEFVFSYEAAHFRHTRKVLYDLDAERVTRTTATTQGTSNGKAVSITSTVELVP